MKFSRFTKIMIAVWVILFVVVLFNLFRVIADYGEAKAYNTELARELDTTRMAIADLEYEQQPADAEPQYREYIGEFSITYYCSCPDCSGGWGTQTSTGATCCEGVTVAVDPSVIPYGTYIYIDGIGYRVAQDCGGAIQGNDIDVYVSNHNKIPEIGRHTEKVWRMIENEE